MWRSSLLVPSESFLAFFSHLHLLIDIFFTRKASKKYSFDPLGRLPSLLPIACACTRARGSLLYAGDEGGFSLQAGKAAGGWFLSRFAQEVEMWMHNSLEQEFS